MVARSEEADPAEEEGMKKLVISNYDPATDETLFCNDIGCWNVSRALRDCAAGKHKVYLINVAEAYESNAAIEVDEAKVAAIAEALASGGKCEPLLGIIEGGPVWMIDGHHRLRALHRLGLKDFPAFIIEEAAAAPYQVWYNGKRKPPFKPY
jgi:hypothetical protein